jgi:hypothetical protein
MTRKVYGDKAVKFSNKQIKALANVLFTRLTNPDNDMSEDDALTEIKDTLNDLGINAAVSINPSVVNVVIS